MNNNKIGNLNAIITRNKSIRRRKKARGGKSQKFRDTINTTKATEESSYTTKKIIQEAQPQIRSDTFNAGAVQDDSSPKVNAFLFLGLFPALAMATLTYFDDDVKKDFMRTFGIKAVDNGIKTEHGKQQS